MPEVALQHVSKTYPGEVRAVQDISLRVEDGSIFALLGPSGCGKTTTLRLIAGLESPTAGRILLAGKDATAWPPQQRNVAFLFQKPALYPQLSVGENLVFGWSHQYNWWRRFIRKNEPAELRQRRDEVVELLRLHPLLDRKPAMLSGGERQRVALGRALIRRPAVFLLDEPLTHLDAPARIELRRELQRLQRELRLTMIWVTHDQAEAMAVGDQIGVLDAGKLLQRGTPREIYERPAHRQVAALVGVPAMGWLAGRIRKCDGGMCFDIGSKVWQLPDGTFDAADRRVWAGIRPEDVRLGPPQDDDAAAEWLVTAHAVEFAGADQFVNMKHLEHELTARIDGSKFLTMNQEVPVTWTWNKVHWFDQTTGERLPVKVRT